MIPLQSSRLNIYVYMVYVCTRNYVVYIRVYRRVRTGMRKVSRWYTYWDAIGERMRASASAASCYDSDVRI